MTDNKKSNSKELLLNISSDLVSAGIVGTTIGYFLDKLLDTKPLMMIISLLFSFIASFKTIYKYLK